jgi:hypothetical protein
MIRHTLSSFSSPRFRRFKCSTARLETSAPALALERKKAARHQDLQVLARGEVSRNRLQRANSLFGGSAKRFQIVDYGGLNE